MKTVKVKQKKNEEKKDIAGRIVGLIFLTLLIAVGYYMYDMFRTRPITTNNLAGDWHHTAEMNEKNTDHWVFNSDGTAMSYVLNNDTKERMEIPMDAAQPETIFIPQRVAHRVDNCSEDEYIMCAYTDVLYDPKDTIAYIFD